VEAMMRRLMAIHAGVMLLAASFAACLLPHGRARAGEADPEEVSRIIEETRAYRAAMKQAPRRGAFGHTRPGRERDARPERPDGPDAPAEDRPPMDMPEQVAYLEESLSEGLGRGDGGLLDLALDGLAAAGKGPVELDASLQRAALEAALSYPNFNERVKIDAWTLAAKARLGDASAADILRDWARGRGAVPAEEMRHDRRAMMRSRVLPMRCAEALPCLAYLKVDGIRELAEEILRGDAAAAAGDARAMRMYSAYGGTKLKGAMQILLDLDREEGTRLVFSLLEDQGSSVDHRARLFGTAIEFLGADDAEKERLVAVFRSLIDAMIVKGFDERRPDSGMMALLSAMSRGLPRNKTVLEGLEALEAALPTRMKRYVTSRVRLYRRQLGLDDKPKPEARKPWPPQPDVPRPAPQTPRVPVRGGDEAEF